MGTTLPAHPGITAFVVLVLACVTVPTPLDGQEPRTPAPTDTLVLSITDAERRALTFNKGLLAARQLEGIARGELRQARTYRFNPQVEFETATLDPEGGGSALDRFEAVVAQEVEWAGQWGLRKDAGAAGLRRARRRVADASRRTAAVARIAFHKAWAAERKLNVALEIADLNQRLRDAVEAQLEAGEASTLDRNLAEIEYGRSRARMLAASRARDSALLDLKRVLGLDPSTPIRIASTAAEAPPPADLLTPDSLLTAALGRRPDLAAADAALAEARTLERLSRREAIPNLRLIAPLEREEAGRSTDIGLGVGFSLPFWNRNQGTSDARRARAAQAAYQREAALLRVQTEVRNTLQAYRSAREEERIARESALGPARTNQRLLEEAYRAGKIDLPSLLLLRNQLLDAELGYWDSWRASREAWVELEAAVGDLPHAEPQDDNRAREDRR